MKCIFVLACLLVAVYAGVTDEFRNQLKSKIMDAAAICIPETKATQDDIAEIKSKKAPSRMEGKCLISCFFKKFGLQNDAGEPNKSGAMAFIEPIRSQDSELFDKLEQLALICGPKVYEMGLPNHCDTAAELAVCTMAESKRLGIENPFGLND